MKVNRAIFAIATLTMSFSLPVWAEKNLHKQLTLPASKVMALHAETAVRNLTINTQPNGNVIQATAYLPNNNSHESGYVFELVQTQEAAELKAYPSQREHAVMDLEVLLPDFVELILVDDASHITLNNLSAKANIQDGAGDLIMSQVENVTVMDKSGDIHIDNQGLEKYSYIKIQDGSGTISIAKVRGDVAINDKSGSIAISDIQGNVNVNDGSGDIVVQQVSEGVIINDGSGDIIVHSSGSLAVLESGSGSLNYEAVKGEVIVK